MADTEKKKDTFVAYCVWKEYLSDLDPMERCNVYDAIFNYASDGSLPDNLSRIEMMAFKPIRDTLDREREKYDLTCKRRSEAGKKHKGNQYTRAMEQNGTNGTSVPKLEQNGTNGTDNDNVYDNDNDNDNEEDKSSIPPISPKGILKGDFYSFYNELNKSIPNDGVERNFSGLMQNLKEYGVDEWEDVSTIVRACNYGQLHTAIWKVFSQLATKPWRPDNMAKYLVKVTQSNQQ